jgi:hypothetical protein
VELSLRKRAVNDKAPRVRRPLANRVNLLLGWRIIPGLGLVDAVERNNDEPLGRSSIKRDDILGNSAIFPAERRGGSRGLGQQCLEKVSVVDFADIYDGVGTPLPCACNPLTAATPSAAPARTARVILNFEFITHLLCQTKASSRMRQRARIA